MKENFYHGLLLGLLSAGREWDVQSNLESGLGYADLLIQDEETETAIVVELKYAQDRNLDKAVETALAQIQEKNYDDKLKLDGYPVIRHCGIGCYKKSCCIRIV